jgi:putative transposase
VRDGGGRSFLRSLIERGLTDVQLVVSDAHAELKKAIGQVLGCAWQHCSVHFLRESLGHVRKDQQGMVAALLRVIFNADSAEAARELVGDALERLGKPLPKVAALLEEAEEDLLAFYCFPVDHWAKLRSTNPLERVNREIGRRTDVVGIFPNDRSLSRLAASVVTEQNDEWLVGRRYLSNHSLEAVLIRKTKKTTPERRPASSPRPEQPTILPTSYTTSWDLTIDWSSSAEPRRPASRPALRAVEGKAAMPRALRLEVVIAACSRPQKTEGLSPPLSRWGERHSNAHGSE